MRQQLISGKIAIQFRSKQKFIYFFALCLSNLISSVTKSTIQKDDPE